MRTTVTLDDDIYQALVTLSQTSGKSLGQVLSALLRRSLTPNTGEARATGSSNFPLFAVTPTAGIIPGNRAGQLLDEDA